MSQPEPVTGPETAAPALSLREATIEFRSGPPTRPSGPSTTSASTSPPGRVVGLVGESGSGKSTLGKGRRRPGEADLPGTVALAGTDITGCPSAVCANRASGSGVVFQDPGSSLNPRWPIGQAIAEPLALHTGMSAAQRSARVDELLDQVHLDRALRNRYPHQLSGGQRQRVGIARLWR